MRENAVREAHALAFEEGVSCENVTHSSVPYWLKMRTYGEANQGQDEMANLQ